MLEIVPYLPDYKAIFRELNMAWLQKHFVVEAKDFKLLNDCETNIIKKGSFVIIALWQGNPVGCYALLRITCNIFELDKMAVDQNYQGLKIGQEMLSHAIHLGKKKRWIKLELYSSTIMDTALYIYGKFGFKEVVLEENSPYSRSDIKMELIL